MVYLLFRWKFLIPNATTVGVIPTGCLFFNSSTCLDNICSIAEDRLGSHCQMPPETFEGNVRELEGPRRFRTAKLSPSSLELATALPLLPPPFLYEHERVFEFIEPHERLSVSLIVRCLPKAGMNDPNADDFGWRFACSPAPPASLCHRS